jgi:hypothetical protein
MFDIPFLHWILPVEILDRSLGYFTGVCPEGTKVRGILVKDVPLSDSARHQPESQPKTDESAADWGPLDGDCSADDPGSQSRAKNQGIIPIPSRDTS